jgi:hypothetical protein
MRRFEEEHALFVLPAFETAKSIGLEEGAQLVGKVVKGKRYNLPVSTVSCGQVVT